MISPFGKRGDHNGPHILAIPILGAEVQALQWISGMGFPERWKDMEQKAAVSDLDFDVVSILSQSWRIYMMTLNENLHMPHFQTCHIPYTPDFPMRISWWSTWIPLLQLYCFKWSFFFVGSAHLSNLVWPTLVVKAKWPSKTDTTSREVASSQF